MKAISLLSATALVALMADSAVAGTSLAEMREEEAPVFALQQEYGDEYGEEETAAEGEGEADAEGDAEGEAEGEEEEGSDAFDPLVPGGDIWHWIRWTHSAIFGIFTPLEQRLRKYDCFSETMTLADELMNLRWMFQGIDFSDTFTLIFYILTAALDLWGAIRWTAVCKDEYSFTAGNPYRVANLVGSTDSFADVDEGFTVGFDIVYLLGIIRDGFGSYITFVYTGWEDIEWVHYTARGITRLVMFIDKMGVGVIKPTKEWARFLS